MARETFTTKDGQKITILSGADADEHVSRLAFEAKKVSREEAESPEDEMERARR